MLTDLKYKFYSLLANQCLTRIGCCIYNIKLSFYILSRKTRLQMTRSIMSKNLLTSNTNGMFGSLEKEESRGEESSGEESRGEWFPSTLFGCF